MAYEAYLDKEKKFILKAKDAAINHISQTFYCKTLGCKACMTLVDASHPEVHIFEDYPIALNMLVYFAVQTVILIQQNMKKRNLILNI